MLADKIRAVKDERTSIIQYAERKRMQASSTHGATSPGTVATETKSAKDIEMEATNTMLEQVKCSKKNRTIVVYSKLSALALLYYYIVLMLLC